MLKLVESKETINEEINLRVELIKQLIPIGLEAVRDMLEREVNSLVGDKYERGLGELTRWGSNPGSVNLGGQKVRIEVPRVRNKSGDKEVKLNSYQQLRDKSNFNEQIFNHVINGISARKYKQVASAVPEVFGISRNSVSRSFKAASAKRLQEFLNSLLDRGLNAKNEILFVIDGAKGIHSAVKEIFADKAFIQRCQWHKRENIVSYLPKSLQSKFRAKLQSAYSLADYGKAKAKLLAIRKELSLINESAAKSLDEGFEETLTLQKLGLFHRLGKSFKTTNCIENLNRQISSYTKRICKWKNSDQRQRWIASALIEAQPRFKTVEGSKNLPELRAKMITFNKNINTENKLAA